MVVRRNRVEVVGIEDSGYEQGTVHCLAQRAALALSNFYGVGVLAVVGGWEVGNVVP
jgi:hypothetical protein